MTTAKLDTYVVLAGIRAWDHTHPDYDDVGFLDLANQVRDMGGPVALFQALFSGAWTEDNRNPLYEPKPLVKFDMSKAPKAGTQVYVRLRPTLTKE